MGESKVEVGVGLSRKWDAREAGREVAKTALQNLSHPPIFFLLCSTIHFEEHGGFDEFLKGVWDVLPKGTPLIGGTVAGFINPHGCYTRGATALAAYYPNMDVAVGYGINTKKDPIKAAKECAKIIQKGLKDSKFQNKFIFDIISGGLVPQIPGLGRKKVIRGTLSKVAISLSDFSLTHFQKGVGREEEVLSEFEKYFKDYYILHGSSMDDAKAMSNYQFVNHQTGTNMIVALGICTDLDMGITQIHNLKEMKKFYANKLSKDGRIIHEINNKPAAEEFLNILGWPEEYFDERLFQRTFFYPIGYKYDNQWVAEAVGIVSGSSLIVLHKIKDKDMAVLSLSGKDIMDSVNMSLGSEDINKSLFYLISTCDTRLEALGGQVFKVYDAIKKNLQDKPFIAIYCGGEGAKKPNEEIKYGNVTFNTFILKNI
jgi:hypothetical protein